MDETLDNWLGKGNYEAWCISLKRADKRRQNFGRWADEIRLSFQFWDATDYLDLGPMDFEKYCNVHIQEKPVLGASACRISITKCLEHFLHNTDHEYVLIFEDDAGFVNEGTRSGSSCSELSCKESLLEFIHQCQEFIKVHGDKWEQIWFGYYDGDVDERELIDENFPLVCVSKGTCSTHAMLFRRSTVHLLLSLLYDPENKIHPIDEFTKAIMRDRSSTLIPPRTIICQTDDERFIDYN